MIRLIAADMDGTLLDSRKRMPPGLVPCVRELARRGVRFAVASGRQYFMLLEDLREIAGEIIIIAENGAVIYDRGERVYVQALEPELLREPVEAARSMEHAGVVLCGADSAYIEDDNPEFVRNVNLYYARCQSVPDVLKGYGPDLVCKLAFFDLERAETHVFPQLVRFADRFTVCLSGDHWVDFMEPGVNKGSAMRAVQELYGIAPSECMAFGDYMNDAEMMEACEYGYAMENAHPDLKKLCRYRAPSNDEDGVVRTIRREFGF